MTPDQSAVLAELRTSASLRRLDLMERTGLTRTRVANALDELRAAGFVQSFSMGSRYSLRTPICPPAATPADISHLANDTHDLQQGPCADGLGAVAHTAGDSQ